jgi:hypothetical protein
VVERREGPLADDSKGCWTRDMSTRFVRKPRARRPHFSNVGSTTCGSTTCSCRQPCAARVSRCQVFSANDVCEASDHFSVARRAELNHEDHEKHGSCSERHEEDLLKTGLVRERIEILRLQRR